jgi:hypothetical protein
MFPRGGRRRTDQLAQELYLLGRKAGIMLACAVLGPPIVTGDVEQARLLLRGLIEENQS